MEVFVLCPEYESPLREVPLYIPFLENPPLVDHQGAGEIHNTNCRIMANMIKYGWPELLHSNFVLLIYDCGVIILTGWYCCLF